MTSTRRQFLAGSVATLAAGALGRLTLAQGQPQNAAGFSFPVLGDLHFDRLAHHDMDWLMAEKPKDLRQIERYSQITADVLPELLAEVRAQIVESPRPVPFVVQVGDLVEGLCGTHELARRHCEEAVAIVADARLGVPMLMTKGNHDITGPGAKEAYDDVLLASMPKELRQRPSGANFICDLDGPPATRLVFFDGYVDGSLDWLESVALSDHDPSHRQLIFVIHQPVVPYTARCWHEFHRENESAQRHRLLALLARHAALVLNGHLHKYGYLVRDVPAEASARESLMGSIRQLSVNSVLPRPDIEARSEAMGVEHYGPGVTDFEPRFSPGTLERRKMVLTEESKHVRHYEYADAPGYAMVHVTPQRTWADVYLGLGRRHWRSLELTGSAAAHTG